VLLNKPKEHLDGQEKSGSEAANQFTKFVTVMFTGLKNSTAHADNAQDMIGKLQGDILQLAIKAHHGNYIQSTQDGSLSYFDNALDAIRAASDIQTSMDALNMSQQLKLPVLVRIGIHSGMCAIERQDIRGDAVEVAASLEAAADGGSILMSEATHNAMPDQTEIYCRFIKQVTLKDKNDPCNAYKAFWNPREIELGKPDEAALAPQSANVPANSSGLKFVWVAATLLGLVLLLTLGSKIFGSSQAIESKRSISDSVSMPESQNSLR
jgi:class 3 adenylate cyclase